MGVGRITMKSHLWRDKLLTLCMVLAALDTVSGVNLHEPEILTECASEGSFHCQNGRNECVLPGVKCDGVANCENGRDEAVEICGCLPSEFQCNETTCIDKMSRCDTKQDCGNGKDELDCETYICPSTTHIRCDNHFCVSRDFQCNFRDDCGDNSDEKICPRRECFSTEFHCNNSQCVAMAYLCDGITDCVDGSDEDKSQCEKHFKCPSGFYIADEHVCDGWSDCTFSQMDELNCAPQCETHQFRCPDTQCINAGNVCDGECDCLSCADEDNCDTYGCLAVEKFLCRTKSHAPRCISKNRVCDTINDCKDSSNSLDEFSCTTNKNCSIFDPEDQHKFFFCPEGRCIPRSLLCDYYTDCVNGEDEESCDFPSCTAAEFTCRNRQCVPLSRRCDISRDCSDWSDEMNCENIECPVLTKKCHSGQCVRQEFWCDHFRDCPDGSDERGCERLPCGDNEFTCNSGQCIDLSMACYFDRNETRRGCADNSHLFNCSKHSCRSSEFKCRGSYCVDLSYICDGTIDCNPTQSDEDNCEYPCPVESAKCVCKRDEMSCDGRQLQAVPTQIPAEHFSKLRFGGNRLNLTNSTFSKQSYDKVTYLDLSNNSLTEIPVHVFDTMWQLRFLHLGDNKLTALRNGTFIRLSLLRQLHLGGNRISVIEENTFVALLHLSGLDLGHQRLSHISKNIFKGLKSITTLNLAGNRIVSVENGAFNTLANVKSIDLTNNRIKDIGENVFLGLPRLTMVMTDSYRFCCLTQSHVDCLPKRDEFSSCEDLMSNYILRISIWVLGMVALCGNFLVIVWRVRDFRGGKVHSFLITNLAIGDFLMGVYLIIIAAVDTHFRGVYIIHDEKWRESNLCQFAGFVSTFSSELSVLTLTTITLDRLMCILFPLRRTRLGLKQAMVIMSLIWCLVFMLAGLPLVGIAYFEGFYRRSGVCLALHVTPDRPSGWEYSVGVFLVFNFVSFLLITFSYLWMFTVAKKTRSAVRTAESKTANAMARRMTLIVMTDFCCWVPIIVLGFVSLAGARTDIQVYAWIAVFVLPLNSATNPVIYTLSTAPFLGNVRKRANRFRKSFIHSFTAETKNSYVEERMSQSNCERKSPYRQLELMRLRNLNSSPPHYYNRELSGEI